MTLLSSYDVIAFAATRMPAQARDFYENILGLRFVADEPFALVFDSNGKMLRISKVQEFTPAPYTILGWQIPDIISIVAELRRKGVVFQRYDGLDQDELGICVFSNGDKVVWLQDPDGNILSLTQFNIRPI